MDDLISRQAAIRWVKTECNPYGKPTLDFESGKKVIEHLKQMPSAEADSKELSGTHKALDTVSRQAVIEAINKIFPADPMRDDYTQGITCGAALANIYVAQLPSAQPETHEERTETHACDLINRQAAIEAMEDVDWYHIGKDGQLVHGANSKEDEPLYKAEDVYKVLEQLPSAQPEQSITEWQKDFREYINMLNIPRDDYKGIMEYINDVPFVQPEPQWIPVSERLPEYGVAVLTYDGYCFCVEKRIPTIRDDEGEPITGDWWVSDDYDEYDDDYYPNLRDGACIAWMPLPEPYRAERRTDEAD